MTRWLAALLVLVAVPAQAAAPDNLATAARLVSDLGGFANIARVGVQTMLAAGIIKSPELYRKVYKQYLDDHPELIAKADSVMAENLAHIYTQDELNAYIAYEETPLGRAIMQKQFAASQSVFSGPYQPAVLTPEEKAARDGFYASPEGKALNAKFAGALGSFMTEMAPYMQQISAQTVDEYCKQGGDCSNLGVRSGGAAMPQTPNPDNGDNHG